MRPLPPGRIYGTSPTDRLSRRRALAVVLAGGLALGSAATLAGGLVIRYTSTELTDDQGRPLSAVERRRLAEMRLQNHRDGRAGVRGSIGYPGAQVRLAGWIDWRRPAAYLSVTGPQPGPADGLVQAVPGVLALRPGRSAQDQPPADPPADGWRVRRFPRAEPGDAPLDSALALLLALAAAEADGVDLIDARARWLRTEMADQVPVDILLGPGVLTTAGPAPDAAEPGALSWVGAGVRYGLDADGRLHRLDTVVAGNVPLHLDFDRADRRETVVVDALGGRPVTPRSLTAAEAQTLATMRERTRASVGGTVTVTLPGERANLVTASGWLDWTRQVAYLAVRDTALPAEQTLVQADRSGIAVLPQAATTPGGRPPLPRPTGGWVRTRWEQRGSDDFAVLLGQALALADPARHDPALLRRTARWLRADRLGGVPVAVYEIPPPAGDSRLRYWADASGRVRRLEVRTGVGAFGQLDVRVGDPLPALPGVPAAE